MRQELDVLVVVALAEEYGAVLEVDDGAVAGSMWNKAIAEENLEFAERTFLKADGSELRVGVVRAADMGLAAAASAATKKVAERRPRVLAMCGICAGRPGTLVGLGDVIAATRVWQYDEGKLTVEGAGGKKRRNIQNRVDPSLLPPGWRPILERFSEEYVGEPRTNPPKWLSLRPRPLSYQEDWLLDAIQKTPKPKDAKDRKVKCKDWELVVDRLLKDRLIKGVRHNKTSHLELTHKGEQRLMQTQLRHHGRLPEPPPFRIHLGALGSGVQVVADPSIFDQLASSMRDVLALDMEAAAVGFVARQHGAHFVVMKGVQDFADRRKTDHFRKFASRASAECLIAFLRTAPRPRGVTSPPPSSTHHGAVPLPPRDIALGRTKYLSQVLETAGRLALSVISPMSVGAASDTLDLHSVYVAQRTRTPRRFVDDGARYDRASDVPEQATPLSVLEHLERHSHLVLLGEPGSGKSTFLNLVAACLAGQQLHRRDVNLTVLRTPLPHADAHAHAQERRDEGKRLQPWSHGTLLPVRVVLRDFAARGLPALGQGTAERNLLCFIQEEVERAGGVDPDRSHLARYAPHLLDELQKHGGFVLLDGLDEVPEADDLRGRIRSAVEELRAALPKCRFLITSRTYSYHKQGWQLSGFVDVELAPFEPADIVLFVNRWYERVGAARGWSKEDAVGRASLLARNITANDRLLELARRPLLLTLMASLHAWRGGSLPERRARLYESAIELLLDRWESAKFARGEDGELVTKQPSLLEWLRVDREEVLKTLARLAYDAHGRQPSLTGVADISLSELHDELMSLRQNPNVEPKMLLDYLCERAGLLVPRGQGVLALPHRTLQEYLAATYLARTRFPYLMAELVRKEPDRWREIALLVAARMAEAGSHYSVLGLADWLGVETLGSGETAASPAWGALIAAQFVAETGGSACVTHEAERASLDRLRHRLCAALRCELLPPQERGSAGNILAMLEDPRFSSDVLHLPHLDEPTLGFIEIPAGSFLMGSDKQRDPYVGGVVNPGYGDETPQHSVYLERYFVARYPVTVAQYRAFINMLHHEMVNPECLLGRPNHPVVNVSWREAMAYTKWLTAQLSASPHTPEPLATLLREGDDQGRRWNVTLPNEAQWERAARGTDGRLFPWGDEVSASRANYEAARIRASVAVGTFHHSKSPSGAEDTSGNVWEWTANVAPERVLSEYPFDPSANNGMPESAPHVLRGGSFNSLVKSVRCAIRYCRDDARPDVGFRVVVAPILLQG